MAKYPHVTAKIVGQDGNAMNIMGTVGGAMRRAGIEKAEIDAYYAEAMSGDYDNVIRTSIKYVNCE